MYVWNILENIWYDMILYYIILYDIIYVNYWYLLGKWKILQPGFIILRLQLFDKKRGIPRYLQATTDASASRASGRCLRFRHFGFWNWFQLLKMTMGFIWWFCQNKATPKSSFFQDFPWNKPMQYKPSILGYPHDYGNLHIERATISAGWGRSPILEKRRSDGGPLNHWADYLQSMGREREGEDSYTCNYIYIYMCI